MSESDSLNMAANEPGEPRRPSSERGAADAGESLHRGRASRAALTSLMIVAQHHGLDWSFDRLLHLYARDREPTGEELARIAQEEGLKSAVQSTQWEELAHFQKALPILARRNDGSFVVV